LKKKIRYEISRQTPNHCEGLSRETREAKASCHKNGEINASFSNKILSKFRLPYDYNNHRQHTFIPLTLCLSLYATLNIYFFLSPLNIFFMPATHTHHTLQELRLNLDRNIKHLSDFKVVMSTINAIQSTTLSVELKIKEMQETFNVLEEHRIQVSGAASV
jgi:hypothetical protein